MGDWLVEPEYNIWPPGNENRVVKKSFKKRGKRSAEMGTTVFISVMGLETENHYSMKSVPISQEDLQQDSLQFNELIDIATDNEEMFSYDNVVGGVNFAQCFPMVC